MRFPLERRKRILSPRHLAQLSIWRGGLRILYSLKKKWIQRLLNPANALRNDLRLYQLTLILDSGVFLLQTIKGCINLMIGILNDWKHFLRSETSQNPF